MIAVGLAGAEPGRAALRVVAPEDVAATLVHRDGSTFLVHRQRTWELVTDPASPLVSQLGDGAFHPMDRGIVLDAIEELGPTARCLAPTEVLVLPYPRAAVVESSCENGVVFLSPGIRAVHPEHVHATVVHELGHALQQQRAREGSDAWAEYLAIRHLDGGRHPADAMHRERPREIFAEDFRVLHGGTLATASGVQENESLPPAESVPGLAAWFEALLAAPPREAAAALVYPNPYPPARGPLVVRFAPPPDGRVGTATVTDLTGRVVRRIPGVSGGEAGTFLWDGRDASGRRVASGVYFVRSGSDGPAARVQLLR